MLNLLSKLLLLAGLSVVAGASFGAEPFLQTQEIFPPGSSNYYHIPGLVVTEKGTVLAYGEWRDVAARDWGSNHVVLRRSTDGGKTFGPEHPIAHLGTAITAVVRTSPPKAKGHEEDVTISNPVAIADRDGTVHFLYCVEYRRVFYMRSDDDGLTWSQPREISDVFEKYRPEIDWKIVATGPGHGIQLRNGRLVVPIWLATGDKTGYSHFPSVTATLYSDDHGNTWRTGEIVARTTGRGDNPEVYHDPNETSAVELADGGVLFNIRAPSAHHHRLESISADGATGWTKPMFVEDLPEPIDFGSIERFSEKSSGGKNRLLFSIAGGHEIGKKREHYDEQGFKREDMTVFLSYDEGKTWPVKKIVAPGPAGCGYSDLTVLPDGTILCAYGTGRGFGRGAGIALSRFNLEWLTGGGDAGKQAQK